MAGPSNKDLMRELKRIGKILEGDPEVRDDDGIKGDVKKNTEFRTSIQKIYWRFVTALFVGNTPVIWFGSQWVVDKIKDL